MQKKFSEILSNKSIIISFFVILFVLIFLIILLNTSKITKLERLKIEEKSDEISNYFDELTEYDDEGKYLNFAIEYLYNNNDTSSFSVEDLVNVINENFDLKYTSDDVINLGITNSMHNKEIMFDTATNSYTYVNKKTNFDISNTKIFYFTIDKIKKNGKNKFSVTYNKYVISNPYEIYNYYNNLINVEHAETKNELLNMDRIKSYLSGEEKIGYMKDLVKNETENSFGKNEGKITVTYVIKNGKLLISKVK